MTRKEFDKLVREAVRDLRRHIGPELDSVDVIVEDDSPDDMRDEDGYGVLGYFQPGPYGLPGRIVLCQRELEAACGTLAELRQEIRKTLFHELGHVLNLEEGELEFIEDDEEAG